MSTDSNDAVRYDAGDHALHIGDVRIDDREVLREATRWTSGERGEPVQSREILAATDLGPFVKASITVGARVLGIASQAGDTLAVQNAVKVATETVTDAARRAASDSEEAVRRAQAGIAQSTADAHRILMEKVTNLVGGENPELMLRLAPILNSVGSNLEKQVGEAVEKANESLQVVNSRRHDELANLIRGVSQEIAVKAAEEAAAATVKGVTTIKGFDYEAQIHHVFAQIASMTGDEYQETGEFAGKLPRNKKGDGVFHVNGGLTKVVIEAHDGSTKEWGSYLAEAERNRGASAAIGVVRHISDNAGRSVRVVAQKRLVVAFDPDNDDIELLHTCVLLMRAVALTSSGQFGLEGLAVANDHIREALSALEELEEAKRSANAIVGHVTKIEQVVTKAMTAIRRDLHQAVNALTGAASGAGEDEIEPVLVVVEDPATDEQESA